VPGARLGGIEANLGAKPKEASADNDYLSEPNLQALADRGISAYVATGRAKHPADGKRKIGGPLTQAMRDKLKRAADKQKRLERITGSTICFLKGPDHRCARSHREHERSRTRPSARRRISSWAAASASARFLSPNSLDRYRTRS